MREPIDLPSDTQPLDIDMHMVWRQGDAKVEADVKALWRRMSVLPEGIDADLRVEEIVSVAYHGETLVGVSTAFVRELEFLRHKFAMLRGTVAPEYRQHNIGRRLLAHSRIALEVWAREHPEAEIAGCAGVIQNPKLVEKPRKPTSPVGAFVLVGYTDKDEQIRVSWFDHVRV